MSYDNLYSLVYNIWLIGYLGYLAAHIATHFAVKN